MTVGEHFPASLHPQPITEEVLDGDSDDQGFDFVDLGFYREEVYDGDTADYGVSFSICDFSRRKSARRYCLVFHHAEIWSLLLSLGADLE
ncbi:unnamed protein product [Linum trigynum]|uniref:Uncharacterized protein n=1 Tax=Linum trigynum TaxID=586398 RepID=A0AAV2CD87_9ROSI